uniref:Longitudinals lacking protein n=1 Tax=Triatoma infestans TaxID=30076 RepID=A0A023EZ95_TRIIF
MAGNQQFCLRWNNHQSTLISVFDNLLESGTLVDCTLAAEGQYLKAHKVVLSACSPFFEGLFSQHYEKHPIIILKDVTFSELKAMLDYMYRGEVNISQEQLGTFLKAAESLQIKGLTDNSSAGVGGGNNGVQELHRRPPAAAILHDFPRKLPPLSKSPCFPHGLVVEQRPLKLTNNNNVDSPPGSVLQQSTQPPASIPVQQKPLDATTTSPKRLKRRYSDDNTTDAADFTPQCTVTESPHPLALSTETPYVKVESKPDLNHEDSGGEEGQYEDEDEEEMDLSKPGTSQHNSHPPGVWNASLDSNSEDQFPPGGSQEQEASWMVVTRPLVQTLKGAAHTSSGSSGTGANIGARGSASGGRNITCPTCNKCYSSQHTLRRHIRLECGKEPQFHCPYCPRKTKQRYNLMLHIARAHKPEHHLQNPPQPPTSHW